MVLLRCKKKNIQKVLKLQVNYGLKDDFVEKKFCRWVGWTFSNPILAGIEEVQIVKYILTFLQIKMQISVFYIRLYNFIKLLKSL